MAFYVYLLVSRKNGTFYTGVTNNLARRIHEHREKQADSVTRRYDVTRLFYYEVFETTEDAIRREKRLKRWPWAWKIRTIEADNPGWRDLYEELNR
ncbi:GIY-YIG nuclease family protein [Labrenzia sp. PHM005]|uniref:GIY-YIG nuclease family protein n=1 Tax=Labrenzia sp. PHM005 TaxID=2590016 RepID=UPI00113FC6C8|nr:GIY-YIG nuclease family protein [Labrenzia sp. PHM005]QDG75507.1 GIY-YIG nuclease family protein [Labrenzia sp. PHM005]